MEATNSSLKQQLQELREELKSSQFGEQSEICTLNNQLAACKDKLHVEAVAKEKLKEEIETLKGNLVYSRANSNFRLFSRQTGQKFRSLLQRIYHSGKKLKHMNFGMKETILYG